MKSWSKSLLAGLCAAVIAAVSLCSPIYARYTNIASTVVKYEPSSTTGKTTTLSADTAIYDFGVWTPDVDEMAFTHTVCIVDTPHSGVLRFSWDDTTRSRRDMAVDIDSKYYTAVQNSGYTDYTVSADAGVVHIPFSLIFANPTTRRVATLDVSWYPDGGNEPTLFARYLVTVMPDVAQGTVAPAFVEGDTHFITDRLLQLVVTTPADSAGVQVTPTDGAFAAGSRYFNDTYPRGVTLVRDSAVYIERKGNSNRLLMYLSSPFTDNDAVSLTVGVSDTLFSTFSCAPIADTTLLTVAYSDAVGVVSADQPLTITLTEAAGLRDSNWSSTGNAPVDLTWTIQRRVGNTLIPVAVGETLTVSMKQTSNGGTLTVSASDGKQAPGTYLLTVTQTYDGYPVLETPIWFFIDYR